MATQTAPDVLLDIAAVQQLDGVQMALELLCEATGCRVALVTRITDRSWNACEVVDRAGFGLRPGDGLELANTY